MNGMRVTLLGTGTSTGVPMIGCHCRTCLSTDPRDKRLRVSCLIETMGRTILIDTSADFRQQMLRNVITHIDAILYTHHHYDHIAGFDDLRAFQFLGRSMPRAFASRATYDHIRQTFSYAFGESLQRGGGLPEVLLSIIECGPFEAAGSTVIPIPLLHGQLSMLGYRVGNFAYLTDCSEIPESSFELLKGLDALVLDGLRYAPHPTHLSIEESVQIAKRIGADRTYLTHMNHDVLHAEGNAMLPEGILLGYDQLVLEM